MTFGLFDYLLYSNTSADTQRNFLMVGLHWSRPKKIPIISDLTLTAQVRGAAGLELSIPQQSSQVTELSLNSHQSQWMGALLKMLLAWVPISGIIKKGLYIQIVAQKIKQSNEKLGLRYRWIFQQDNNGKHITKLAKIWFMENNTYISK